MSTFGNSPNHIFINRSTSTTVPLILSYGSLAHAFQVPTNINQHFLQIINRFLSTLDDSPPEHPTSTDLELLALFIGFLSYEICQAKRPRHSCDEAVLSCVLHDFEQQYLLNNEIHSILSTIPISSQQRLDVLTSYYTVFDTIERQITPPRSALIQAAENGSANIYTIFGGQGNTGDYFNELRDVFNTYPFVTDLVNSATELLCGLTDNSDLEGLYTKGLNIIEWLRNPESTPDAEYLISAPVSLPLIGLLQFTNYNIACRVLGLSPGEFASTMKGITGHSQGIVVAAACASADSWETFAESAKIALTILLSIGARSQKALFPEHFTRFALLDSVDHDEGSPTPMLNVRGLPQQKVQNHMDQVNMFLAQGDQVSIALINSPNNFVLAGNPLSLYSLNVQLRPQKLSLGLDQSRIPFSKRKTKITSCFLPITAPFHSTHLIDAKMKIEEDLAHIKIMPGTLRIPVYSTETGEDLRSRADNIVPYLVELITCKIVDWEKATTFLSATHIIDFGPGGVSGVGALTNINKDGAGVRVILAGIMEATATSFGYRPEIFSNRAENLQFGVNWLAKYGPRLVNTSNGHTYIDTKMSRLLGAPPLMVAGMTPSTVPWSFVSAVMKAGYHIELAGAGYYNIQDLGQAVKRIEEAAPVGRGITINLIYANHQALTWQIPGIRKLRAEGARIEGLTFGAGVPSIEIATEYIDTMNLKHIGFKPGSLNAIKSVLHIATVRPSFPIILQWTGGRGGGHHSFEDFHQPILQMYSQIRSCPNIVLIGGSGFGGSEDTYPYLSGTWSTQYGVSPMPFDGCLLGSRMMISKEAHTSRGAKHAIVNASGVNDSQWEDCYKGPAGGIITVQSELGEPIHKIATRGVRFWAELDQTIFSLPKQKRLAELNKRRSTIMNRLNTDFQKVWFGCSESGKPIEVEEMTYAGVVRRLLQLLYVSHEGRWIDVSYKRLIADFIRRLEERFILEDNKRSLLHDESVLEIPLDAIENILKAYPEAQTRLISKQDVDYFIQLCQRKEQKPPPFIPVLDENFEYWFKKDSLWQSEDLAAVIDNDAGRTCILHGPVAAKYSKIIDQPAKDILDEINEAHIEMLKSDLYSDGNKLIPVVESFGGEVAKQLPSKIDGLIVLRGDNMITYSLSTSPSSKLPSLESWLDVILNGVISWSNALLRSPEIAQGHQLSPNPLRRAFQPVSGLSVEVRYPNEPSLTRITLKERRSSDIYADLLTIMLNEKSEILVNIIEEASALERAISLELKFTYHPYDNSATIQEVMDDRIDRIKIFYWQLWFGDDILDLGASLYGTFKGDRTMVTAEAINKFRRATGNRVKKLVGSNEQTLYAPMEFAVVVGWKALMMPMFCSSFQGDFLRLVHLTNRFEMTPGAQRIKAGDITESTAQVNSIINQDSGKMIEVCCSVTVDGKTAVRIVSQFLFMGVYTDFERTFERKTESPMKLHLITTKDVAILKSKKWIHFDKEIDLLGNTLVFGLETHTRFENRTVFSSVECNGKILLETRANKTVCIGSVSYRAGVSQGNPVIDYLQRKGSPLKQPSIFKTPVLLNEKNAISLEAPPSNRLYAQGSGDYNPIHVSRVFANYANLPGTITHGMYISAAVQGCVEQWALVDKFGGIRNFFASFSSMVLPNQALEVKLSHVGMLTGHRIINIEVRRKHDMEIVLQGEAEVEDQAPAYVFTGQGSQQPGMGMALYERSAVAKSVWDKADKFFMDMYGFEITNIVRNNPKELTVYFGGAHGRAIRSNYMTMMHESVAVDGTVQVKPIFKEIDETTTSYTYKSPDGLLLSTQFTQPALALMEKAILEDMRSKQLISAASPFAGHSLGEYSALTALADIMPIEKLVSVVFFRGLIMQFVVERGPDGRSNYSMCAVNPSRISPVFSEEALKFIVQGIVAERGWLLEVVNYNVANMQYVCTGTLQALHTLTNVLNFIKEQRVHTEPIKEPKISQLILKIISTLVDDAEAQAEPVELRRGTATIPLKGIDVPFHSTFLKSAVPSFRRFLEKEFSKENIESEKLIGKYIPNVTAKPFDVSREYFEDVYRLTSSPRLATVLANWNKYQNGMIPRELPQTY